MMPLRRVGDPLTFALAMDSTHTECSPYSRVTKNIGRLILVGFIAMTLPGHSETKLGNEYKSEQLLPYLQATEWILYSLDPDPWLQDEVNDPFSRPAPLPGSDEAKKAASHPRPPAEPQRKVPPSQEFHEYPILGQLDMKETDKLRYVIKALDVAGQNWAGGVAGCFSPRHGIRVMKDGKTHDLVICYECSRAYLYVDGQDAGTLHFATTPQFQATPYPLDGILRRADIKRAPSH
ncbi:hypothetical protein EI77_03423 [Prosthecobacter fusiformis]|uniref:Uncharacterized protein n=2 Tax=Prosthecobacter fusiformis TaxID=48464 RepID=A0A4R7RP42_9BACT|nr:hypothetical protein EI77_03423 [Prosthecobacter fusiformis]